MHCKFTVHSSTSFSTTPLAVDSSSASAPAPSGDGATATAADLDSPSSVPRPAESDLPATIAESVARPGDPSSVCAPASCGSRRRPQSTTQTAAPRTVVQTSERARSLPSPDARSLLAPRDCDKTLPLPRGAPVAALAVPRFRYPQTESVGAPGGSHNL